MKEEKVKNIIFDVGNILLGYRWSGMLLEHGLDEERVKRVGKGIFDSPYWTDFDAGRIRIKELLNAFSKEHPDLEEDARWFLEHAKLMRVERPEVWELVKKLKEKGYHIYLLSNYSEELFTIHTEGTPIMGLTDGAVVSYQIHELKPEPPIYEYLLEKYQLKREECLFFDDRPENTEAARKLGIAAVTIRGGSEKLLKEELGKLL